MDVYVLYTFVFVVHGEVFVHTFTHIRRPLILKYWTNEVNHSIELQNTSLASNVTVQPNCQLFKLIFLPFIFLQQYITSSTLHSVISQGRNMLQILERFRLIGISFFSGVVLLIQNSSDQWSWTFYYEMSHI